MEAKARDQRTGEYRRDVKVLHLQLLETGSGTGGAALMNALTKEVRERIEAKGWGDDVIVVGTTRDIQLTLTTVQQFVNRLADEKLALQDVDAITRMIRMLERARRQRWDTK
jgi:hypothetical protein